MSATFNWQQTNGPTPGTATPLASSGNLFDFKNKDTTGVGDYATWPVPAGSNSFEVWLQGVFTGSFSAIYDLRFWQSVGFANPTGLVITANTAQQFYCTPNHISSSIAIAQLGTSDPGTANVSVGGLLNSSITSSVSPANQTDYIVLQLQTLNTAVAGDTSSVTFSLSYIEQ